MIVSVDRNKCCGSGLCASLAPEVFGQHDTDGLVTLLTDNPLPAVENRVRTAASTCPTSTIMLSACPQ
ncbi:ferredoxin [Streptomyces sp. NPDC020490]|uniref:ferredoxin n=1 Tax=Streptomyces sp. NPDC020490 TaxID=3365078 RepID=UPI00379494CE